MTPTWVRQLVEKGRQNALLACLSEEESEGDDHLVIDSAGLLGKIFRSRIPESALPLLPVSLSNVADSISSSCERDDHDTFVMQFLTSDVNHCVRKIEMYVCVFFLRATVTSAIPEYLIGCKYMSYFG